MFPAEENSETSTRRPQKKQIGMQRLVATKLKGNVLHRILHLADQAEENSSVHRERDNTKGRAAECVRGEVKESLDWFSDLAENKQTRK